MILRDYLGGYHRFCLEKPYHLDYVSDSLFDLLGYTATEIHNLFHDKYSQMVYEKDRNKFLNFIDKLAQKEQTLTLQYRIVHKDGHIIYLNDIMTSRRLEDGRMYGFAIIADITDPGQQKHSDFLPPPMKFTTSYGFLQCTCEKYPKITHMNSHMMEYLGITEESSNWMDLLKENIFFMIPFSDRDAFQKDLETASNSSEPLSIEHQLLRSDGSRITLTGSLSIGENEYGEKTYTLFYTQAKKNENEKHMSSHEAYLCALKCAYHVIFQINLETQIVECIHGRETSAIGPLYDFQMAIDTAKSFWLNNYIIEEDQDRMSRFMEELTSPEEWKDSSVLQSEFRIRWRNHKIYAFLGVAVQLDDSNILLCCRNVTKMNSVTQENVPEDSQKSPVPAQAASSASESEKAFVEDAAVFARTFGHFDLFVHGVPVIFSGAKEKELMALLIDRKGGTLTSSEAISYLWPDEDMNVKLSNRYRKLAMKLKNTLTKYGIEHILINNHGIRSIDVSAVTCDCYEMLAGNEKYSKVFSNSYMTDYSWSEETLARLYNYTQSEA
jgi:PAS domain S-box-containing protein